MTASEVENIDGGDSTFSDSDDEHAFKRRKTRVKRRTRMFLARASQMKK